MADVFRREKAIADGIPMGQPILVGHHSEGRHRSDLKKMHRLADKGVALSREIRDMPTTASAAIMAGDADAIYQLHARIARERMAVEKMRAANKAWRCGDRAAVLALGYSETQLAGTSYGEPLFDLYRFTNAGANIRRLVDRVGKLEVSKSGITVDREIDGLVIRENVDAQRVQIIFPEKPDAETRKKLVSMGFRWSPNAGAWQRNLNNAGRWAAAEIVKHRQNQAEAQSCASAPSEMENNK